ncbi:Partner of Y14 and mago [Cladophialophora carrionii]|uniref:Partner of Y14 and mago n=1 Tax=Cladophialophora carrionii TaxID=86049 RepID=A0A1C1D0D0_9EURO|nr:Partner of Y14 and mago [Cladophialophora carrionii]
MPVPGPPHSAKSGIQTSADGASYIPSSRRADGSTRKEIRVRPGYRPPEDIETYKNRSAEAWKNRTAGTVGVPGAETDEQPSKSKNAKRREAARRKAAEEAGAAGNQEEEEELTSAMKAADLSRPDGRVDAGHGASATPDADLDAEQQKKIRNQLKKLRAVQDLKEKKAAGEKLSHDQIMKIGKEMELHRDLSKLGYDGPEALVPGQGAE